ncbi:lyase family protein [Brevibacterium picturae]|uniref:argininosuccinate lyase n=1 Tax=Brevibacterium picturae TaxID=260553 RepID=A0ABP4LW74_9MICO
MLDSRLTDIVYGTPEPASRRRSYEVQTQVDLAHLVMLREQELVAPDVVARLAQTIQELRTTGFEDLIERPAPRGMFMAYEDYLSERLGHDTGGRLHTGRSRNDLNATTHSMITRDAWLRTLEASASTVELLTSNARKHSNAPFPGFSHWQPAMPSTFGGYLANVGLSLAQQVQYVAALEPYFDSCPLGACAGFGTNVPIDSEVVAGLLGYHRGPDGALAAVADRSVTSFLLGGLAEIATLSSRLAADLQFWSAGPVRLLQFPDDLVGMSSIMPQKRNAFVLENIKGRCASVISAHTECLLAMKSAPFANTIEVAGEAVSVQDAAVSKHIEIATLINRHIEGAEPLEEACVRVMKEGNVTATFEAERMVLEEGLAFRDAYNAVRELTGKSSAGASGSVHGLLDPATHGAGPSPTHCQAICDRLDEQVREVRQTIARIRDRIGSAEDRLKAEVERMIQCI